MDTTILNAEEKLAYLAGDEDTIDLYRRRFIALCDRTSAMNNARKEGLAIGHAQGHSKGRQEIINLLKSGKSAEEIVKDYEAGNL